MAFTYDLTTDQGKVRFNLGDTVPDAGPRPDKRNFSDEEIDHLLSEEGSVVVAATAFGFEILTSEWRAFALKDKEDESEFDAKGLADGYAKQADDWRAKPGGGTSSKALQAGVIGLDVQEKGDNWQ